MSRRNDVIATARSFIGIKQGSDSHRMIIKEYNRVMGSNWNVSTPWCVIFWSYCHIINGDTKANMPLSASCSDIIHQAQALGYWVENDAFVPSPGDGILYDWEDNGIGDDTTGHWHIGIVADVCDGYFNVIEGNHGDDGDCNTRKVKVNQRYIRGFIHPEYAEDVKVESKPKRTPVCILVHKGDTLNKISAEYGVSVEKLVELNKKFHPSLATNPNLIKVGWTLRLR